MENFFTDRIVKSLESIGAEPMLRGKEIVAKCIFSSCDDDSRQGERHLYISADTGGFMCHKCQTSGSLAELKEKLNLKSTEKYAKDDYRVYENQIVLPAREYLNERGITNESIVRYHLGYGTFYGQTFITIPIFDAEGTYIYKKLRLYPTDQVGARYKSHPQDAHVSLYGVDTLIPDAKYLVISEGEFDCIILKQLGINAVTSTGGAGTFKDEWLPQLSGFDHIYIWFDNDKPGRDFSDSLQKRISLVYPEKTVVNIKFDNENTEKDITELHLAGFDVKVYLEQVRKESERPIDVSQFKEMSLTELQDTLGLTIKKDNDTKVLTFLAMLSSFTEDSEVNVMFNAPSSAGKTYIATEVGKFFPPENTWSLGYCSPMSFFHDNSITGAEGEAKILNLEHKIIIMIDAPHTELLAKLRPILSHDVKELHIKITDKVKGSNKTKDIVIKGYPCMVFCTANPYFDEQEQTRFIILSPEVTTDKIWSAMQNSIRKESNPETYKAQLEGDPLWKQLKDRVRAVKQSGIKQVYFDEKLVGEIILPAFSEENLQPRDQRELKRIISLMKAFTLLNFMKRERIDDKTILSSVEDAKAVMQLWKPYLRIQRLGISPYMFDIYSQVLLPLSKSDAQAVHGLNFASINAKFLKVYHKSMERKYFNTSLIPSLANAGIVEYTRDPEDKRDKRYRIRDIYALTEGEDSQSPA